MMFIRKYLIILSIFFTSCAGPVNLSSKDNWAEKTLGKLTLREKISQMMVVSINLNFFNFESQQWVDLQNYIKSDGIGVLHIWFRDAGTSLIILNEMQKHSKVPSKPPSLACLRSQIDIKLRHKLFRSVPDMLATQYSKKEK